MEFLGIGPTELIVVFVLALIFVGPGKMPEVVATVGKIMADFRRASAELTEALHAEIAEAEAQKAAGQAIENDSGLEVKTVEAVAAVASVPGELAPVTNSELPAILELAEPSAGGETPAGKATPRPLGVRSREPGELEAPPKALLALSVTDVGAISVASPGDAEPIVRSTASQTGFLTVADTRLAARDDCPRTGAGRLR